MGRGVGMARHSRLRSHMRIAAARSWISTRLKCADAASGEDQTCGAFESYKHGMHVRAMSALLVSKHAMVAGRVGCAHLSALPRGQQPLCSRRQITSKHDAARAEHDAVAIARLVICSPVWDAAVGAEAAGHDSAWHAWHDCESRGVPGTHLPQLIDFAFLGLRRRAATASSASATVRRTAVWHATHAAHLGSCKCGRWRRVLDDETCSM